MPNGFVELPQHIKDIGKCQTLLPKESDFKGKKGYKRTYRPDGGYDWTYDYRPNVAGKPTKEGGDVYDAMLPFMAADSERHRKIEAARPREVMKDKDGGLRFIDPALAGDAARNNGWSHVVTGRRSRVEGGIGGMLWKADSKGWRPLGRWCLSRPFSQGKRPETGRKDGTMRPVGVQYDPDGNVWRFVVGEWRQTA